MIQVRVKHILCLISLSAVNALTEEHEADEKDRFYDKLNPVLDQWSPQYTLIVLGKFSVSPCTQKADCDLYVGPHNCFTRNNTSSPHLDFAKFRRFRIAGDLYQRSELHFWTCYYSNIREVTKDIDHILVRTCLKFLQNWRVFQSVENALQLMKVCSYTQAAHEVKKNFKVHPYCVLS